MTERKIRAGIVGLGDIAKVHAQIIKTHPLFELVGGADLSDAARQRFSEDFGVSSYGSLDELLGRGPDVVLVCTPNSAHAAVTIEALEAGALVLCEKPPALNADQAMQMAEAAERTSPRLRSKFPQARGNLLYGLVYRHMLAAYEPFLKYEELGGVPFVFARWERARGVPARGLFTNLAASGGGSGIDLGVHVIDLAWSALGCPRPLWVGGRTSKELARSTAVRGYGDYDGSAFEVEDTAVAVVAFEHTMLVAHAAFASNVPGGEEESAEVVWRGDRSGFKYRLHTADRNPADLLPEIAGERFGFLQDTTLRTPLPLTVQQGYRRQIGHLADVLAGTAKPIVNPEQGVVLMEIMDAVYESAEYDRPVVLS